MGNESRYLSESKDSNSPTGSRRSWAQKMISSIPFHNNFRHTYSDGAWYTEEAISNKDNICSIKNSNDVVPTLTSNSRTINTEIQPSTARENLSLPSLAHVDVGIVQAPSREN